MGSTLPYLLGITLYQKKVNSFLLLKIQTITGVCKLVSVRVGCLDPVILLHLCRCANILHSKRERQQTRLIFFCALTHFYILLHTESGCLNILLYSFLRT